MEVDDVCFGVGVVCWGEGGEGGDVGGEGGEVDGGLGWWWCWWGVVGGVGGEGIVNVDFLGGRGFLLGDCYVEGYVYDGINENDCVDYG